VPPKETDLATPIAELRAMNPQVVAILNAGAENDHQVTIMNKAGLAGTLTTGLLYLSDVDRVKEGYAGVVAAVPWYWNLDAAARTWSDRFAAAHGGLRPTAAQAADYSATTQWLQAVKSAGTVDADAVVKTLDGHRFDDMFARHAEFRSNDHMVIHDLYIARVRAQPPEPHAWYEMLATVPAADAFPATMVCKMTP
jgi:branched-chain amino acid transport system substrate-binding protein